ncbi:hypothetical protein BaRGS_00014226 [Batillaria attramentaria]|uniref:Guided entry of tail-anchored proteins factor 1 n=1 Tax=Batillaria attramentaria TaxID=370345 RepID=A0ABD0L4T4_9CAEN
MMLMTFILLIVILFAVLQKFVKEITVWVGKRVFSVSDEELDLRAQVRDLKEQQSSISMMDEFARYMKLQRQIDKLASQVKDSGEFVLIFTREEEGWFFPIQRLIAMPSGVEGGIGIVSWILVCNSVVFRAKRMLDL